ncbi:MAG: 2-phosphosulfolactate phosphatase [Firmicutes bacterium]|nr:2-phosphosulfolactate phosphatase [Bacillota bacterium]
MQIQILQQLEGAKKAKGIAVIIDVFRAFTTECFFIANGAKQLFAVGEQNIAYTLKKQHPDYILAGERNEIMLEGFDYGNSPANIEHIDFTGKTVVHTTSAGTQGIANACYADEILTGSFVNALAISKYIKKQNVSVVSLVCMGKAALSPTEEDTYCAEYIKSLLLGENYPLQQKLCALRHLEGERFFNPQNQIQCPQRDFYLATTPNQFDFVLRAVPYERDFHSIQKIEV